MLDEILKMVKTRANMFKVIEEINDDLEQLSKAYWTDDNLDSVFQDLQIIEDDAYNRVWQGPNNNYVISYHKFDSSWVGFYEDYTYEGYDPHKIRRDIESEL